MATLKASRHCTQLQWVVWRTSSRWWTVPVWSEVAERCCRRLALWREMLWCLSGSMVSGGEVHCIGWCYKEFEFTVMPPLEALGAKTLMRALLFHASWCIMGMLMMYYYPTRHTDTSFLHDWPWISPGIKLISNELDIVIHVIASQLSRYRDVISSRLWCHQQNEDRASETREQCVKILVFIVIYGFVMSCKK